jgi:hypothetical protein
MENVSAGQRRFIVVEAGVPPAEATEEGFIMHQMQ